MLAMSRRKTIALCLVSWALLACGASSLVGLVDPRYDPWRFFGLQNSLFSVVGLVCGGAVALVAGFLAFLSTIAVIVSAVLPEAGRNTEPNDQHSENAAEDAKA